jgi:hypothetical protein
MPNRTILLLALLCGGGLASDGAAAPPPVAGLFPDWESQCGAECLYAALRLLGKQPDYQRLLVDAGTDDRGTSIAGLIKAAQLQGCHALGVRADRKELCDLLRAADQPLIAICHQDPDHFVVWFRNRNGKFTLIDPKYQYPDNRAEPGELGRYSGAAVLIGDEPIRLAPGGGSGSKFPPWLNAAILLATLLIGFLVGLRMVRRAAPQVLPQSSQRATQLQVGD